MLVAQPRISRSRGFEWAIIVPALRLIPLFASQDEKIVTCPVSSRPLPTIEIIESLETFVVLEPTEAPLAPEDGASD
jgi:hypothetical protein